MRDRFSDMSGVSCALFGLITGIAIGLGRVFIEYPDDLDAGSICVALLAVIAWRIGQMIMDETGKNLP